jgi:excisionase family DNA binding protein
MRLKDLERWITPGDLAQELGISRQAVHKRLKDGKLRAVKTRQGWLIDPAEASGAGAARRPRDGHGGRG